MFTVPVGGEDVVRPGFEHVDLYISLSYNSANLDYWLTYVGLTARKRTYSPGKVRFGCIHVGCGSP
jgi:hypothetical protein